MTTRDERDELRRILEAMVTAKLERQRLTLLAGVPEADRILNDR